ncbi:MAG: hypothetical protein KY464_03140 [Gemmatimonadetes bacterium]|nr:hypothetical protein [Gemmatimonadota bacterium]
MSSRGRSSGNEPEFRWVIAGRRNRLSLIRRLSLSFEIRRRDGERQAELWMYAEDCVRRWRISARALGAQDGRGGLATEMEALPIWAPVESAPPLWDQGRCVIEGTAAGRLQDVVERGPLTFALQGDRVTGDYCLVRTTLALNGRPQWVIRRENGARPAEQTR